MTKVIGVIPARIGSTRLPKKALRTICGHPMIEFVYRRAIQCKHLNELYIATDSDEIMNVCEQLGLQAIMTGEHNSGTDRVFEVMTKTDGDIYLNIQGDEPMVEPKQIEQLITPFLHDDSVQVTTLCTPIDSETAKDPNIVKAIFNNKNKAIYFSRYPIPYDRDNSGVQHYKHLGFYGYTRTVLSRFHFLQMCPLEEAEKLEQLRFMHFDMSINLYVTKWDTISVDHEPDLDKVSAHFTANPEPWF